MKLTLTISTEEPSEDNHLREYLDGPSYKMVLDEFFEFLRQKQKYQDINTLDIDDIRQELRELMDSHLYRE